MRVTDNTNYNTIRDNIQRSKNRMEDLQTKSATLKKLNTPSDDPVGASKVLELRTDKMNNDQYQMNAKMAETFLSNSELALGDLADIVVRAKEIALGQSSGASSNADTRLGVAEEIAQLYQHAVATANRQIGDRYLFGGYKTEKMPVDPEGRYQGDDGQMMVEIAKDVFISMNLPGIEAFNTNPLDSFDNRRQNGYDPNRINGKGQNRAAPGDPNNPELKQQKQAQGSTPYQPPYQPEPKNNREPASNRVLDHSPANQTMDLPDGYGGENVNVFDELQNLRIALLTGDLEGIHNTLDRFDQLHGKLTAARAKIGSRLNGLQTTSQAIERHNLTNAQLSSTIEDADMAQVVSDLSKEEQVLKSSLASSQKLIQPTLLDFLK
jgi:flagellar hook-associated protein 3 FlgL